MTHLKAVERAQESARFNPRRKVYIYGVRAGAVWKWHFTYNPTWMEYRRVNKG